VRDFGDRSYPDYDGLGQLNPHGILREEALLEHGDIVFVRSNGNKDLVGRSLFLDSPPDDVSFSAFCIRARLSEALNPRFYSYFFRTPHFRKRLALLGKGTNISNLNQHVLKKIAVPAPSRSEKSRVVALIRPYDDLIENNRRRIQLLEQAARLLYKDWFVRLRFPGHEHVKITDGVPEGWEKVPLSELCTDIRESANPRDLPPDTAYIGLEHIPRRSVTLDHWGMASDVDSTKFRFAEGDILFGKIRPYFHKVGFALVNGIASSDAIVIRPTESSLYYYALFLLSSDGFVSLASKTVREGSKMPRADWKFLLKSEFLRPSESLIDFFSDVVRPVCNQLRVHALHSRKLSEARDLLLPRLMSGEAAL